MMESISKVVRKSRQMLNEIGRLLGDSPSTG
jgi:hypothetical protein